MLAGLCIELRRGSGVARALVHAHLSRERACIVDRPPSGICVIVDLEDCSACPQQCSDRGPLVMIEDAEGVRVSMRVDVDRMAQDLIPAIRMVARTARLLPAATDGAPPAAAIGVTLSDRERQVVDRIAEGKANKVIARELGIAEATVKIHMTAIMRKTGALNRTQVALWVARHAPRQDAGKPGDLSIAGR